jgi:hypothetical protein
VLGVRADRQGKATSPVWGELLLLELGIQASGEGNLKNMCRKKEDLTIIMIAKMFAERDAISQFCNSLLLEFVSIICIGW